MYNYQKIDNNIYSTGNNSNKIMQHYFSNSNILQIKKCEKKYRPLILF